MRIAGEEIFGLVLSVIRLETEAKAIAMANDSPYGLAASVWSDNIIAPTGSRATYASAQSK